MPHQCVRCGKIHDDGSKDLLKGCDCGGKFFLFIKKDDFEGAKTAEQITINLSKEDKAQIEKDVLDLVGEKELDKPVILDVESIRVLKPGKFEIDLVDLFKGAPLVYKLEDGKYIIDIATTFQNKEKSRDVI
jgi:predicted  nucleic acid-binding Zn-ribbon protein